MTTQTRAIVDKLLTGVSNQLIPVGFIAEMILPILRVKQRTGKIGKYGNNHLRIINSLHSGKGGYRVGEAVVRSSDSYAIQNHALKEFVTQEDKDNVELPFDAEKDTVINLTVPLQLEKEFGLASVLGNTSIITNNTTLSGTSQFSDYDDSDPLTVTKTARLAVRNACGVAPNKVAMDYNVAETLRNHPQLLDKLGYKYNRSGGLTDDELARVLSVKKVLISEAMYNSAKEGQTDVLSPVWGKHLIYITAPDSAQVRQKSLGYDLGLTGRKPRQVHKSMVDEPVGSTKIMVLDDYEQLLTDVTCAYLIKNSIA
jgi:hypothetical protein